MWGKTELKKGQLGKITILKPINLWERDANDKLTFSRVLNPGEEYRVYRYEDKHGGQYGLGGGMWITKMPTHIKYETPSKTRLEMLKKATDVKYKDYVAGAYWSDSMMWSIDNGLIQGFNENGEFALKPVEKLTEA